LAVASLTIASVRSTNGTAVAAVITRCADLTSSASGNARCTATASNSEQRSQITGTDKHKRAATTTSSSAPRSTGEAALTDD
jgi:hypothetical protein